MREGDGTLSLSTSVEQSADLGPTESSAGRLRAAEQPAILELREPTTPDRIARFRVLDELGRGGMGLVLSAHDDELDRKVAIKLIRWDAAHSLSARARMKREARALARLNHPNVVGIYDVGELDDGRMYVAMEHVRGQTLDAWLEQPRPWPEILAVFRQSGEGLLAAHRAGLVHRDFKPSNVMLGHDGRVRVLDFGLARAEAEAIEAAADGPERAELELTSRGAIVGTPAYMAPEQHEGREADARSDQFSFCVALFEALFDRRPYLGDDRRTIHAAITSGAPCEPPPTTEVPASVRRAVLRGLARDPGARWPSLEPLLAALRPEPRRRRLWLAGIGGAVVALALGIGLASTLGEPEAEPEHAPSACADARAQLRGAWDQDRAAAVTAAFARIEGAYAEQAAPLLVRRLDDYAAAWSAMFTDACEAHRRGEHSEQLFDRRMTCLRHRRIELASLVDRFAEADEALVQGALSAVAGLPDVGRCGDLTVLAAQLPSPDDPTLAVQVDALRDELARAAAADRAGRHDEARAQATRVAESAHELGYGPLEAEARLRLAYGQERDARYDEAEASLTEAYLLAEQADHELVRAEIATLLAFVIGVRLARIDDGMIWARQAERLIEAIGEGGEVHAQLLAHRGALDVQRGELPQAITDYRRAIALLADVRGPDHPKLIAPRLALGAALGQLGRLDDARAEFEEALRLAEYSLGDLHPSVAAILNNLGTVAYAGGALDQAIVHYERALVVYRESIGVEHPEAAATLNNLGAIHTRRGDYEQARAELERALAIRRATLGEDHPLVAAVINNLAVLDAREGDHALARQRYEQALAILEAHHGPRHPTLRSPLAGSGVAAVELGDYAAAIAALERAEALGSDAAPIEDRAQVDVALARALWAAPPEAGRDRPRALALARAAVELLDGNASPDAEALRAQARAWLSDRGGRD